MRAQAVSIVGAGLAGSLLALMLARRGFAITLYDRRSDPRTARAARAAPSILRSPRAASARSNAPKSWSPFGPLLIAMRGRMLHDRFGELELQPYGRTAAGSHLLR
jgi:kynurenine 3-monooxygenase